MALHDASRRGEAETIRDLVHEGADIEARDDEGRTPLLLAAECGHVAATRALIEAGADIDAPALPPGKDSNEPAAGPILPVVCRRGLIDRVWPLVRGQETVRGRREGRPDGPTPLMAAAAAGHAEVVAMLLDAGADAERADRDGFSALAYAAAFGHVEVLRALIRAGAYLDPIDHYRFRPVGVAALLGQTDAVRSLAEAGADLTAGEEGSLSPLHAATRHGHADAVRALLAAGADATARAFNSTPLEMALSQGRADIVAILVAGGADVNSDDWRRLTPLLVAIARGDQAAFRCLLAGGAGPNRAVAGGHRGDGIGTQSLPTGATALHLAACREGPEFVAELLAAGADPLARDSLGFTPLSLALASGNVEAASRLRSAAHPAEDEEPALRSHELIAAVRRGDELAVRALLAAGASPQATIPDTFKYHYLLRCEQSEGFGDFDPSRDRGPGTYRDAGRSALALAIERGHDAIATVLLTAGASTEGGDESTLGRAGKIPLAIAAGEGRRDVASALLGAGANVEEADPEGRTPLFHAARAGHAAIVRDLIAAGARVDIRDGERRSPLGLAAEGGHADCIHVLLEAGATPRPGDLSSAATCGHVEAALVLLEALKTRGIEPEPQTLAGAVYANSTELVRRLLDAGVDPSSRVDGDMPALHWACHRGVDMVRILLDAGADPNLPDREGRTPVCSAILFGGPDILRLLLERGARPEGRMDGATDGETPLIRLAGNGLATMVGWHKDPEVVERARARDLKMIRLLITHGADLEARDRAGGRTALMHAAEKGCEDHVRVLLDVGSQVNARDDRYGRTALHWAAHEGRAGAADLLITAGAELLAEDADGLTAEDLARRGRHDELARSLHARAVGRPRPRRSPASRVVRAIEAGDTSTIRKLLGEGADVDVRLAGGKTPLLFAVERRRIAAAEMLLAAGANPNIRDADDLNPLMAAIEANRLELVRRLLDAGADPNAGARLHGSEDRQTPLNLIIDKACQADLDEIRLEAGPARGEAPAGSSIPREMARALIDAGADVNLEDGSGSRPLWYALDLQQPEIAELLLAAGAGGDFASDAYVKARGFSRAARAPGFLAQADALAARFGLESQPLNGRASSWDFRLRGDTGRIPTGPTIGREFATTRDVAEAVLAEQHAWRRRGVFPVRTASDGTNSEDDSGFSIDSINVNRQRIGLLPTDDPYVVIAALCRPGTDWGWVSPAFTIRDLKALEPDYPFNLIGCESGTLEIQFTGPIVDPADLVRRLWPIRAHLWGAGLSEHPDEAELTEYLSAHTRVNFYWE